MEILIALAALNLIALVLLGAALLKRRNAPEEGPDLAPLRQDLTAANTRIQDLQGQVSALAGVLQKAQGELKEAVQVKLTENLKAGFEQFKAVQDTLKGAEAQLREVGQVGRSIQDLNALLKLPHLRGGFGEMQMEQVLANYLPPDLFEVKARIDPASREQVDAVLKLPEGRRLPLDAKFPREQVLPLFEAASTPEALREARKALAQAAKAQAKSIHDKYIRPEHGTLEMALMFLPSETLYHEVIRDAALWEHLTTALNVYPVSPATLSVTLKTIALAYEWYQMTQGVGKAMDRLHLAQKHFENFRSRFEEVGLSLGKAQEAYGTAGTHLTRYEGAVARLESEGVLIASLPTGNGGDAEGAGRP